MKSDKKVIGLLLPAAYLLTTAMQAHSQYTLSNGYVCDPKNPGGEETRRFYRQQDGVAINISPTATFPVVCPVVIPSDDPPYEITISFQNTNTSGGRFSCALEEHNVDGTLMRSIGNAVNLPAQTWGLLNWSEIFLMSDTDYLSLRCILPPKGGIGAIEWY